MKDKRTYQQRAEYLKQAGKKRRKRLRMKAVEYKGGRCQICGYNKCVESLDFHHIDPKKKDFGVSSSGITRSWYKVRKEIDKCIMVCANCHREIHAGQTQLPTVTLVENRVNSGKPS